MKTSLPRHRGCTLLAMLFVLVTLVPWSSRAVLIDVELADLPVTDALKLVARQASLDLEVDPLLENAGHRPDKLPWAPPSIQLKLKQVAADQVLESLAGAYGLVLDRSLGPSFIKLRFARSDELVFKRSPRVLPDPLKDQRKVPLLVFDEAPAMQVVQTLALQSRLNLVPSHELVTGTNMQGVAWQDAFLTIKIRNVTPQQALEAALDASGLVVDWSGLGQVGVIYPAEKFARTANKSPSAPPALKEEKTDFTLADLAVEDFVQLAGTQMNVNWVISTAARQAVGEDKQPLIQSNVSVSKKGVTPLAALQEVLKSKGLEFRWNGRAEVGVVDLLPRK